MSWRDRLDADMKAIFADRSAGPADDVELLDEAGVPLGTVRGFFEHPTVDADAGAMRVAAAVRAPMLSLLDGEADAVLGRPPMRGDMLTVRGQLFRIEAVRPDGIGMQVCKLKEVTRDVRP